MSSNVFVAACVLVLSVTLPSIGCELKPELKRHAISLDYNSFDQSDSDSPWRKLASEDECYKESAELIDYYLSKKIGLRGDQVRNLHFHAGQMYAISGDTERSIRSFKKALWQEQPDDFPINWNAYVTGTVAYLMRDRNQFDKALDALEREVTGADDLDLMNIRVLRKMRKCWAGRYQDIIQRKCGAQ